MRLEAGPVPMLDATPAQPSADAETFLALEESFYGLLGASDLEIGSIVDTTFESMAGDMQFILDSPLDQAGDELDALAGRNVADGYDDVLGVREEIDADVIAATNEAVAESWQEIPPKFEPAPDVEPGPVDELAPPFQPE